MNKDFIDNIKRNHFEYGYHDALRNSAACNAAYCSETKARFNFAGNAEDVRGKMNAEKKSDLTRNHFQIGGNSANVALTT